MSMDFMSLKAKLTLDSSEYEDGLNKAERDAGGTTSKLASGAKAVAKGFAVAGAAAATAVGVMTKSAVSGYAEFEQLEGGIQTLFGKAAPEVMANASKAFQSAGMSANKYMETSINSAAALINSLGGDQAKAAKLMDMSIIDMSDNVNKMGTDMEAVQNAYRGFSRGNFTMLDNLALGFSGTKQGMQELLDKAEQISGVKYDIGSYADIVQAIHVVQQEMGVSGTTAQEASDTITGSMAAVKAAWENLVTGFANPEADLDQLINNVVDNAEVAFGNMIPIIEKAINGIASFVEKAAPILTEKLPGFIDSIVPGLLAAGSQLLMTIVQVLPGAVLTIFKSLTQTILDNLPQLIETAFNAVVEFANGLTEALPEMVPAIVEIITTIATTLLDNIDVLIEAALQLVIGLANALVEAIPLIVDKIPYLISSIVSAIVVAIPQIFSAAVQLFTAILTGLLRMIPRIVAAIPGLILAIVGGLTRGYKKIYRVGRELVSGLWRGIKDRWSALVTDFKNLASGLVNGIKSLFGIHSPSRVFAEIGKNIDEGFAEGIRANIQMAEDAMDALNDAITEPTYTTEPDAYSEDAAFDVLAMSDPVSSTQSDSGHDVTVILQLDRTQLARTVFRLNNEESQRVGVNLAGGFA